ncbi:hypothetical protein AOX55_00002280 [Sinorhizobium fredii CCBAU 25509]|nr:hypothetical protein AOX55_00002280 [Sinorhizobium fredii CCBAU 25509]
MAKAGDDHSVGFMSTILTYFAAVFGGLQAALPDHYSSSLEDFFRIC